MEKVPLHLTCLSFRQKYESYIVIRVYIVLFFVCEVKETKLLLGIRWRLDLESWIYSKKYWSLL